MNDLGALYESVVANPFDDTAKLVYADGLEETRIEKNEKHAKFIRLHINHKDHLPEVRNVPINSIHATDPVFKKVTVPCAECQEIVDLFKEIVHPYVPKLAVEKNVGHVPALEIVKPDHILQFHKGFVSRILCTPRFWSREGPNLVKEHPLIYAEVSGFRSTEISTRQIAVTQSLTHPNKVLHDLFNEIHNCYLTGFQYHGWLTPQESTELCTFPSNVPNSILRMMTHTTRTGRFFGSWNEAMMAMSLALIEWAKLGPDRSTEGWAEFHDLTPDRIELFSPNNLGYPERFTRRLIEGLRVPEGVFYGREPSQRDPGSTGELRQSIDVQPNNPSSQVNFSEDRP